MISWLVATQFSLTISKSTVVVFANDSMRQSWNLFSLMISVSRTTLFFADNFCGTSDLVFANDFCATSNPVFADNLCVTSDIVFANDFGVTSDPVFADDFP
jgi:hypothetical protein